MIPYYEDEYTIIYNADCREVMSNLQSPVNLIVTDPPYGIDLKYDIYIDTEDNWFNMMGEIIPMMRKSSKMVIMPACRQQNLRWYYANHPPDWLICWYKGSPGHRSHVGFNDWESHLVYGKNDGISMHDYFQCTNNERMGNYGHPCPKPLGWASWLISNAAKKGDIVFDCFAGSGTTIVAARQLGIKSIGCEISEKYCESIIKRLNDGGLLTICNNVFEDKSLHEYINTSQPTLLDFLI